VDQRITVFATGSYGRGEASMHSDLDYFLVTRTDGIPIDAPIVIDEVLSAIERAREAMAIPGESSGHAIAHDEAKLIGAIGDRADDFENTLTCRLLLLLESRPIVGDVLYETLLDKVLSAYWRDYEDNRDEFVPGYLANDILRLWRTFCINYEARTSREPEAKRAKRLLKNYKLKHSRLLTCYSGLAYLLHAFNARNTVTIDDARRMIGLSPTERIADIGSARPDCTDVSESILTAYEDFLRQTDESESQLIDRFLDHDQRDRLLGQANDLGNRIFDLIRQIGMDTRLGRLLVV